MIRPCIIVPVYNHEHTIANTLDRLARLQLACIVVDDGCDPDCRRTLERLRDAGSFQLIRHAHNRGKGAAIKTGITAAAAGGYSHALQVDADGQHDIDAADQLLRAAESDPEALVTAQPIFDASVPRMRYYSRYLTHVWVWINTLSLQLRDSMCGFRVYPVAATSALLTAAHCGDRMDFETEILVRWLWRGGHVIQIPTAVHYPPDGVSHFRLWRDNALISAMHARLFFGMLRRLPTLVARSWR